MIVQTTTKNSSLIMLFFYILCWQSMCVGRTSFLESTSPYELGRQRGKNGVQRRKVEHLVLLLHCILKKSITCPYYPHFQFLLRLPGQQWPGLKSQGAYVCVVSLGVFRNQTWLWKVAGNGCSLAIISLETISNNLISSALDFFIYNKDIGIAVSW